MTGRLRGNQTTLAREKQTILLNSTRHSPRPLAPQASRQGAPATLRVEGLPLRSPQASRQGAPATLRVEGLPLRSPQASRQGGEPITADSRKFWILLTIFIQCFGGRFFKKSRCAPFLFGSPESAVMGLHSA